MGDGCPSSLPAHSEIMDLSQSWHWSFTNSCLLLLLLYTLIFQKTTKSERLLSLSYIKYVLSGFFFLRLKVTTKESLFLGR